MKIEITTIRGSFTFRIMPNRTSPKQHTEERTRISKKITDSSLPTRNKSKKAGEKR
ncbi:hypothetical protein K7I13_10205 [Brucepastera parasyntrophica]|uniref:hypothetical protein n=1 Tax=Brucepastera parasyntrophica TaxID=2880008 RepID=UPI00210CCA6E|nr:hypothetical protein [Brucepastera parasyntrophica]ULQ58898.1 hypothetical protein K7I13_10205 [Brucepastera parasyntrophica]